MADTQTVETKPDKQPKSVRVVLLALMITMMLAMLDNMIVGTAMPTIVGELGGLEHLSWVVTAYTLATAAATPIWGKLGDMYGRKATFMTSIVIFLIGSALSGMAQNMGELIGFRAVQGLGAGGLMVGVMAIIGDLIPPRERGKYQGMMAGVMALAMIGGPLVGGTITDNWGWRWSFYINLPLGIFALGLISVVLHLPKKRAKAGIDYLGVVLLTVGITAIVLVTTWGGTQYAWTSARIMELIGIGVASLIGFVFWQTKAAEPVVPLHIFRSRNFTLMSLIGFITGFVMFGATLFLPLYQQSVQGASATNSGLLLLPMLGAMLVTSMVAGRVTTNTGKYKVFPVVGSALMIVGLYLLSTMDTGTSRFMSGVFMAVVGLGMGCLMQITMLVAQNSVEMKDMGVASSSTTLFRTLGSSFGVAIMGALFNNRVQDVMSQRAGSLGSKITEKSAQLDAKSLEKLPAVAREAYQHAVSAGVHSAFLLGAIVAVGALIAAVFVKEVTLRGAGPAAPKAEQEDAAQAAVVEAV
ncbi:MULTISPECIES: MDR family MFS transporter [Streptomyces]|jgi:EmrB/QacA subfamily drug resistance transporter|uniref:MFS transporter n=1 Tax=Streptomyces spinosisporus TaxID=2927582 RepID=A0ABS9XE80_9ACTN|nr:MULTISPECIES: MDR family MFS transporter [Streptomyces]EPD56479.1 drug:H+ antiporter-2 (14 Spanner) (DHA2) family drug resistance MFS transporter [Streptomyces sp. HGB0020]MCI3240365.1 MFS transporter [Streptomyces spinosisporus]WUB37468.1 MFS transporter [Streptomyces sp. NBC_00588]